MKKIIVMTFAALSLAACNNDKTDNARVDTEDTTTTTKTTTTTSAAYAPAEGDVTYRNNKVMVMRNGEWVEADRDVKLENDVVVYRNGKARKGEVEIELEEGEVVDRSGNVFDKTGRAIENAWDATKEGVKDAGRAVGNAAEKVGKEAKDVVDDDDKDEKQ
jgi:hypothetical protein